MGRRLSGIGAHRIDDHADGEVRPLRRLGLESIYPVVQGYKDVVAYGAHARFSDPVSLNGVGVTATFSPASSLPLSERAHVRVDYRRFDWNGHAAWNNGTSTTCSALPGRAAAATMSASATRSSCCSTSRAA